MNASIIHIVEAGDGWTSDAETIHANGIVTLDQAMVMVAESGYQVMANGDGGCCETQQREDDEPTHIITVWPVE